MLLFLVEFARRKYSFYRSLLFMVKRYPYRNLLTFDDAGYLDLYKNKIGLEKKSASFSLRKIEYLIDGLLFGWLIRDCVFI